jgi:hypothetical protein
VSWKKRDKSYGNPVSNRAPTSEADSASWLRHVEASERIVALLGGSGGERGVP